MLGKLQLLQVGADIEVFLLNAAGTAIPSTGLIGGTKDAPRPLKSIPNWKEGYAVQEDNVALEYNIPPASDGYALVYHVLRAQEAITQEIAEKGLRMAPVSSMRFTKAQLDHPQAQKAGCEPDYCVWDRKRNDPVDLDAEIRGAGAHVHVSFLVDGKKPKFPECLVEGECLTMAMDIMLGVASMKIDKDTDRRRFYGRAGAFRPKPYGIEYRVLGPWWTTQPKYIAWVFQQVQAAVNNVNAWGGDAHNQLLKFKELTEQAINDSNEKAWLNLSHNFNIQLPK